MRIVRASMRLSLFGGGCDLPEYYETYGATLISCAIDKSIYLIHNRRETGGYRLSYSKVEELSCLQEAEHTLVRQAARQWPVKRPCTLSIISDLPRGTGLGSSSALAVALTIMLYPGRLVQYSGLAREAYELERKTANVGIQDHLPAVFGGCRIYRIDTDGEINESGRLQVVEDIITNYGLLVYTGRTHDAAKILPSWSDSIDDLHRIHDLAESVVQELKTISAKRLGEFLNETWKIKSEVGGVADAQLRVQYDAARAAGALGGKLLGAGGGGCWFFIAEPSKFQDIVDATRCRSVPFSVSGIGHMDVYI